MPARACAGGPSDGCRSSVLIFYVDETGNAAVSTRENSTEFKHGTSNYFTLAGVGIRDSSREPLARYLLRLKGKHFGEIAGADWGETEIKGRYLLHVARALDRGGRIVAPTGWQQFTDRDAFDALVHDLSNALLTFRPLVLVNVVDKRKMAQRDIQPNPIGIAYSYLQRNIALTLEHQHAGEGGVIVADQQTQHEALFKSGGIHEIRSELEKDLTRVPNYNLVLDKPLWVDTELSVWDREIIQLADVAAFLVTKLIDDSEPPHELAALWEALMPQFARHHKSGRILGRGIAMYPPRSSKLTL